MTMTTTYRIFDSMDRPASQTTSNAAALWDKLRTLQAEAEEDGDRTTYAIGKILPNGEITYDY